MATPAKNTYLKETIALRSEIEGAFLELGKRLHKIRDEKLYEGEFDNFDEFLLTAKISKATASKLITVYETFILKFELPVKVLSSIGWSSLYSISSHATTKDRAEELVERAAILTREDLETSLKNEDGKQNRCLHPKDEQRMVCVCGACGFRRRVYDNDRN